MYVCMYVCIYIYIYIYTLFFQIIPQYALHNQEQNPNCPSIVYSEPNGQPQCSNDATVRNSKEMKAGYMPLTERHDNVYQFPNMESNTPGYGSSGAPFLLGKPPAPYKHPESKERAQEYANSTVIEKTEKEALSQRMQSLGKPVLPEALQQYLAEEIRGLARDNEERERELPIYHNLEGVEEEVSWKTLSCKALEVKMICKSSWDLLS